MNFRWCPTPVPLLHGRWHGDRALRPTMQRKFIELADAAFPGNPTSVHALESSRSPFLSMPDSLSDIILRL